MAFNSRETVIFHPPSHDELSFSCGEVGRVAFLHEQNLDKLFPLLPSISLLPCVDLEKCEAFGAEELAASLPLFTY